MLDKKEILKMFLVAFGETDDLSEQEIQYGKACIDSGAADTEEMEKQIVGLVKNLMELEGTLEEMNDQMFAPYQNMDDALEFAKAATNGTECVLHTMRMQSTFAQMALRTLNK